VSKRNRKAPNRNRTPARAEAISPASLPPGIRIRHATAADLPAVRELTASAGCPLDDELAAAVKAGDAGSALRAGVEGGGRDTFTYRMAEKLHGSPPPPPLAAAKAASLILVAERSGSDSSSDIGEVIGALSAGPPSGVIRSCLDQLPHLPPIERGKIVMSGLIFMSKLYAIATVPSARGQGVASALIRYYRDVYTRCGYRVLYGEMDAGSGLEPFYRRNGFEMVPVGAALDLYFVFGHEIRVGAGPGERIFVRMEQ
jgi:GNAT superfamily N-acetyltransferase